MILQNQIKNEYKDHLPAKMRWVRLLFFVSLLVVILGSGYEVVMFLQEKQKLDTVIYQVNQLNSEIRELDGEVQKYKKESEDQEEFSAWMKRNMTCASLLVHVFKGVTDVSKAGNINQVQEYSIKWDAVSLSATVELLFSGDATKAVPNLIKNFSGIVLQPPYDVLFQGVTEDLEQDGDLNRFTVGFRRNEDYFEGGEK